MSAGRILANPPPAGSEKPRRNARELVRGALGKRPVPAEMAIHARNVVMKRHTVAYFERKFWGGGRTNNEAGFASTWILDNSPGRFVPINARWRLQGRNGFF